MKKLFTLFAAICFLLSGNLFGQSQSSWGEKPHTHDESEIFLPNLGAKAISLKMVSNPELSVKLQKFSDKYGDWTFLIDKQTGTVHRAFGDAVKLLDAVDYQTVRTASLQFLRDNENIFEMDVNNLDISRIKNVGNKWYVGFKQFYKGIEVLLSEVELRFADNGNLSNFGMVYYPVRNVDVSNLNISKSEAELFATIGVKYNQQTDVIESDDDIYILPYTTLSGIEYRVVYRVEIKTSEPIGHYFAYVDAHSGETLWRQNMVFNANKFHNHGDVKPRFGNDIPVDMPFEHMNVRINGTKYETDENGSFDFDIQDSATVNASFEGKWAKITLTRGTQQTASFSKKIGPADDLELLWDDDNSHVTERNLFYHANAVHDYVRDLDTGLTAMDFQLSVTVDFSGQSPNAYSGGKNIGYIGVGVVSMRLAECAQVMYHEYGHSVNGLLYQAEGKPNGMINSSCNEGHADLFSSMIQDDPRMGVGVWVNDSTRTIRNLKNTLVYPDDIQGDGHYNGMILGGAFWDLREATSLEYVQRLSHFTKYGLPDDADIGKAFSEWFIETLFTDDDDGNLSNGTPNIIEIVKAFNAHQIGTNLFMKYGFQHEQHPDTKEVEEPYTIDFVIQSPSIQGSGADSVLLIWSINDFEKINIATAQLMNAETGEYQVKIPAQKAGTFIKYYMHAWEPLSQTPIDFYKSVNGKQPFTFLVGYNSVFLDGFENSDWTSGDVSDNAQRGMWENAIPQRVDMSVYGIGVLQPGADYSDDGMKCWVTGAKGSTMQYAQYMPNGRTTLISPEFDLNNYNKPVLKYQRWFFNLYGISVPGYETYFRTELSFDGGLTWERIESTKEPTDEWEETYIMLHSYIPENAEKFKVKFIFDAPRSNQVLSLHEGLIDDFEILSIDESLVSVDEYDKDYSIEVYPNPFSNSTAIRINQGHFVSDFKIYNILGMNVRSFSDLSGVSVINWDGRDNQGIKLESGLYIYKIIIDGRLHSGKIVIE